MSNSSASSGGGNSSVSPPYPKPVHVFTIDELAEIKNKNTSPAKEFILKSGKIQLGQYYTILLKSRSIFGNPETFAGFFVLYSNSDGKGIYRFYNTSGQKNVLEDSILSIVLTKIPSDEVIIDIFSNFFYNRFEELLAIRFHKTLTEKDLKEVEITPNQIKHINFLSEFYDNIIKATKNMLEKSKLYDPSDKKDITSYDSYFSPTTEDLTDKIQFPGSPNYQSGTRWTVGGRRRRSRSRATRQKKNRRRSTRSKRRGHIKK
jgi:hypothetical protein